MKSLRFILKYTTSLGIILGGCVAQGASNNGAISLSGTDFKTCSSQGRCLTLKSEKAYGTVVLPLYVFSNPFFEYANIDSTVKGKAVKAVVDNNVNQIVVTIKIADDKYIDHVYDMKTLERTVMEVQ